MGDLSGQKLDGIYLLEGLVGEGGMADVYLGKDLRDDRVIAVKVLRDEFRDNDELVRRFKNEGRAISVLNHDNIVKVFDVSVSDKLEYMVMEYIDGITLKEYIEQRGEPLTYKETIHFTNQILKALQHAHDKGIVHRDIKPQNIMLTESGNIKIMDFGIARLARSEKHQDSDQAIGSVHYISPEQAKGESTDQRADLYSVGIMMYEMLSGRLPFESDDVVSIAIAQISDQAVPLTEVNRSVPGGLAEITMKAMAKEPRQRYQSALEMMRDIEEFKLNPSVKFEYDYLQQDSPTRYIDTVVNDSKRPAPQGRSGGSGRPPAKGNGNGRRTPSNGRGGAVAAKKKKKKRVGLLIPITLGITIAVVAACAVMIWNLFRTSGNPLFTEYEDVALPDFTGMQYEEVQAMCKKAPYNHLRFEEPKVEHSPGVEAGQVVNQNPTSSNDNKKMVKANQRIYLTVAQGVQDITVPPLEGMTRNEAVKAVLALGLRPYAKPVVVEEGEAEKGKVIGTEPAAGTVIQTTPDQVLTILIATERKYTDRTVPSIVGQNVSTAAQTLLQQGLNLGPSKEVFSDSPAGTIIGQSPAAGSVVKTATSVYPTVSAGPEDSSSEPESSSKPAKEKNETVKVPGVAGGSSNTGAKTIEAAGFKVSIVEQYHDTVPKGVIISQDPSGGTKAKKGSTVTLVVSKGAEPVPDPPDPPDTSGPDDPADPGEDEDG